MTITKIPMTGLLATSLLLSSACGSLQKTFTKMDNDRRDEGQGEAWQPRLSLQTYESCDALSEDLAVVSAQIQAPSDTMRLPEATPTAGSASDGAEKGSTDTIGTNVQEQGVDETDRVKIGAHHIFALSGSHLHIVDRQSLKELGIIDLSELGQDYSYTLYADGDRLVVLSQFYAKTSGTRVTRFQASAGKMPEKLYSQELSGQITGSRLIGDKLFLMTQQYLPIYQTGPATKRAEPMVDQRDSLTPDLPSIIDQGQQSVGSIPCQKVLKKIVADPSLDLTALHTINLASSAFEEHVLGALGYADLIYMSQDHLYLAKTYYPQNNLGNDTVVSSPAVEMPPSTTSDDVVSSDGSTGSVVPATRLTDESPENPIEKQARTFITRIELPTANADARAASMGMVSGIVEKSWSFKDFAEKDAVAIVSRDMDTRWNNLGSRLTILKHFTDSTEMVNQSSISGIAPEESLHAVRYVDSFAYLVTFRNVDPLFVIDLQNLDKPELKGELKIPGFSDYLHPIGDGLLVGVGYDATEEGQRRGVQVSLFNVNDPTQPHRLDFKTFGTWGHTPVANDHRAFFYDPETRTVAVPMMANTTDGTKQIQGAQLIHVGTTNLEVKQLIHHESLAKEQNCTNSAPIGIDWAPVQALVDRVLKVDGQLISLSPFGMMSHSGSQWEVGATIARFELDSGCTTPHNDGLE